MSRKILRTGQYIRYDTTQRYHMISLDEQDFFVWRGDGRLELSDMGHEAAVILHTGAYLLFIPEDMEKLQSGMLHLACQEGDVYHIYELPQGLPTETEPVVTIQEIPKTIPISQMVQ
ncbi:MAG TPA: hypothetical protein V6C99_05270 [Oculatellaceae cyanobacterium]|jgi:hypothetical protein